MNRITPSEVQYASTSNTSSTPEEKILVSHIPPSEMKVAGTSNTSSTHF